MSDRDPAPVLVMPPAGGRIRHQVRGEAGNIECELASARAPARRGVMLVCHPHPLYGGAMQNKVVSTLVAAAHDCGMASLRFNFRGVGSSEGSHDEGRGETRDCVQLGLLLRDQLGAQPLVLAGFSFGGFVALSALPALQPDALITVAPAWRYLEGGVPPQWPRCPWLCVHAQDDDVVSPSGSRQAAQAADTPPELVMPELAGHFFHGALDAVRTPARHFLERLPG